ncbi:flagellar motor protein MotB [Permianibacter sp. IMCC34836]|uniref:flagellar motor protein MotB n=1 Tax=Permianibacter fluminis TaxID=2738515 RepID=UPI001554EEAD|nr:flagellar motor protein MotB [Permianibacter fluminis]NQD38946.1 flagellar motor protein MotB [Permianibacter fluminis]
MADDGKQPLIIKKVNKGHGGAHGGAWKVAFADFVTAMMAFFLLLWLLGSTTKEQKGAISKYFTDPGGTMVGEGGVNASLIEMGEPKLPSTQETPEVIAPGALADTEQEGPDDEQSMQKKLEEIEQQQLEDLKQQMMEMVESNMAFTDYKDQILIDITPEGLRIQIVDKDKRPMFDSGSPQMQYYSIAILQNLAKLIAQVPNRISITGHTDATLFADRPEYSNWELSADRANAARRALVRGGVPEKQIARVEGFSDSMLFNEQDANDPINRRIAIIVLKKKVDDALKTQVLADWAKPADGSPEAVPPAADIAPATDAVPAPIPNPE